MDIRRLSTADADFTVQLDRLLHWAMDADSELERTVADLLASVRSRGDQAVLDYTRRFDRLDLNDMAQARISAAELEAAWSNIGTQDQIALRAAADRIRHYHEHQQEDSWSFEDDLGNRLGQKITALDRVGVYVPGGQACYPSSVLMTLIPARVAGVRDIVVTVPTPQGARNDMLLAALYVAQADEVYTIGGAQAIAALAFGTETIARVDKIVGPGGAFVAAAKRQVFGQVGIDMIAGPSEVLVVSDGSTDPEWAAMDLYSQAEHDAAAQAIIISPDDGYLDEVARHLREQLSTMQRAQVIEASLSQRGGMIHCRDLAEAVDLCNRIAPEHLELHVADPDALLDQVRHAGAIFCGPYAGEALGDYAAGPSHVLPTFGTARFASPLGVYDFVKRSSVIRISPQGAAALADVAVLLANQEGLQAHARAAAIRAAKQNG